MNVKRSRILSAGVVILASGTCGFGQGTFRNLDFEQATIVFDPTSPSAPYAVYASNAIPGWTAYLGTTPQPDIIYDTITLGSAAVSIHDTNDTHYPVLQGVYDILLQPFSGGAPVTAGIGQTGQIPLGSQSLRFFGNEFNVISADFAGTPIPLAQVGISSNGVVWAGDISAFAGQTGELRFTATPGGGGLLDNIFFSTQPAPEPSTFVLLIVGAVLLGWPSLVRGCKSRE
jgi:hypothetical protein